MDGVSAAASILALSKVACELFNLLQTFRHQDQELAALCTEVSKALECITAIKECLNKLGTGSLAALSIDHDLRTQYTVAISDCTEILQELERLVHRLNSPNRKNTLFRRGKVAASMQWRQNDIAALRGRLHTSNWSLQILLQVMSISMSFRHVDSQQVVIRELKQMKQCLEESNLFAKSTHTIISLSSEDQRLLANFKGLIRAAQKFHSTTESTVAGSSSIGRLNSTHTPTNIDAGSTVFGRISSLKQRDIESFVRRATVLQVSRPLSLPPLSPGDSPEVIIGRVQESLEFKVSSGLRDLAQSAISEFDLSRAEEVLEEALKSHHSEGLHDQEYRHLRVQLSLCKLIIGRFSEAAELILDLVESRLVDDATSRQLLYCVALSQAHDKRYSEAKETCERLFHVMTHTAVGSLVEQQYVLGLLIFTYRRLGKSLHADALERSSPNLETLNLLPSVIDFIVDCPGLLRELFALQAESELSPDISHGIRRCSPDSSPSTQTPDDDQASKDDNQGTFKVIRVVRGPMIPRVDNDIDSQTVSSPLTPLTRAFELWNRDFSFPTQRWHPLDDLRKSIRKRRLYRRRYYEESNQGDKNSAKVSEWIRSQKTCNETTPESKTIHGEPTATSYCDYWRPQRPNVTIEEVYQDYFGPHHPGPMIPFHAAELPHTPLVELWDTSPRVELEDTGLSPTEIINKHSSHIYRIDGSTGSTNLHSLARDYATTSNSSYATSAQSTESTHGTQSTSVGDTDPDSLSIPSIHDTEEKQSSEPEKLPEDMPGPSDDCNIPHKSRPPTIYALRRMTKRPTPPAYLLVVANQRPRGVLHTIPQEEQHEDDGTDSEDDDDEDDEDEMGRPGGAMLHLTPRSSSAQVDLTGPKAPHGRGGVERKTKDSDEEDGQVVEYNIHNRVDVEEDEDKVATKRRKEQYYKDIYTTTNTTNTTMTLLLLKPPRSAAAAPCHIPQNLESSHEARIRKALGLTIITHSPPKPKPKPPFFFFFTHTNDGDEEEEIFFRRTVAAAD